MTERIPIAAPPDNPPCFACSSEAEHGLRLTFFREGDAVVTEHAADARYAGWDGILHGGMQSLLLDEVSSWAAGVLTGSRAFVTAELRVWYRRPVPVEELLTIRGWLVGQDDHRAEVASDIRDASGALLTEGRAVIRKLSAERFEALTGRPPPGPRVVGA